MVIFIHKEEIFNNENELIDMFYELIVAKNRGGKKGKRKIHFIPEFTRFEQLTTPSFDSIQQPKWFQN